MTAELDSIFDSAKASAPAEVIDRSEAERWATCPHSARLYREQPNAMMDTGNEVHRIASEIMFARQEFGQHALDLRAMMQDLADKSRPDVQPEVVAIIRRGGWKFIQRICAADMAARHPDDLMRYDGGKGERSGQLAADIEVSGRMMRLTAELDLLMATPSPSELDLDDYKSGRKWWTPSSVRTAFQWQWYSWLIFRNYHDVNRVNVRVHMMREGVITEPVYFDRSDMLTLQKRIVSAVELKIANEGKPAAEVVAWPDYDKCGTCDSVARCLFAAGDLVDANKEPAKALQQYVVLSAQATRAKSNLSAVVRKTGQDIIDGATAFGVNKPRKTAETTGIYEIEQLE